MHHRILCKGIKMEDVIHLELQSFNDRSELSAQKKHDLLKMMDYIRPENRQFYKDLIDA